LSDVIDALRQKGVLVSPQLGTAQSFLSFRNHALHANWEKIDRSEVASALAFVQEVIGGTAMRKVAHTPALHSDLLVSSCRAEFNGRARDERSSTLRGTRGSTPPEELDHRPLSVILRGANPETDDKIAL
jgi:hypothetical protein